jgi:hypothetical protein
VCVCVCVKNTDRDWRRPPPSSSKPDPKGRRVLGAPEHEALKLGYRVVRLQTGTVATPAVALYDSAGYRRIAPFGPYREEPLAAAFEKRFAESSSASAAA